MTNLDDYACPDCGSQDYRKLSLIYQEGTTKGSASIYSTRGLYLDRDSVHFRGSTVAADSASPPVNPLLAGCGFTIISIVLWLVGCIVAAIAFPSIFVKASYIPDTPLQSVIYRAFAYLGLANIVGIPLWTISALFKYPRRLRNWNRTYQCQRCGTYFRIEP